MRPLRVVGRIGLVAIVWLSVAAHGQVQQEDTSRASMSLTPDASCSQVLGAEKSDLRRTDACIRSVFAEQNRKNYFHGMRAYFHILRQVDSVLSESEQEVVRRHVAQMAFLLPDSLREPARRYLASRPEQTLRGEQLVRWWRRQDPLPATRRNERLIEHLERVSHALNAFAASEETAGFDARGRLYVRLGPPARKASVSYNSHRILQIVRETETLSRMDFRDNTYWVYPQIGPYARYLFVEEDGRFKVGDTQDLIPSTLKGGLASTRRGQEKVRNLTVLLEEIYSQLGTVDVDLGSWYQEVHAAGAPSVAGGQRAPSELQNVLFKQQGEEDRRHQERAERVPLQQSRVLAGVPPVPVAMRTARFLERDSTTRTEVYWRLEPGFHRLSEQQEEHLSKLGFGQYRDTFVKATAMLQSTNYRPQAVEVHHHAFSREAAANDSTYQVAVHSDMERYRLALQWGQYAAREGGATSEAQVGPRVKLTVRRVDSLRALTAEQQQLEMSDLKPIHVRGEQSVLQGTGRSAPAYPYSRLPEQGSLALYFEVYHLRLGGTDQAEYTVEYEVARRGERNLWQRLTGRETDEQRTGASTTYTSSTRTAREYVLLDLNDLEGPGPVRITVRVTDESSGQQVERTLTFGEGSSE